MTENIDPSIPKPVFVSGDETSMVLSWKDFPVKEDGTKVILQFKIPEIPWEQAMEIAVENGNNVCIEDSVYAGFPGGSKRTDRIGSICKI